MRNVKGWGAVMVVAGIMAHGADALASGRTNDRYIGYQGRLEFNGRPWEGPAVIRVALFANANDSTACLASPTFVIDNCGLYRQQLNVTAAAGEFSTKVGPITDATALAPARFIAVAVVTPTAILILNGKQELIPAWSAQGGEDLVVGRTITAVGNVQVGGPGPSGVDSRLSVRRGDDTTSPVAIFMPNNNTQGVGLTWQGVTKVGTAADANLELSGKGNGDVRITSPARMQNGLNVQGATTTTGNVTVGGIVIQQCRAGFTPVSDGRLCISALQAPMRMHQGAGSADGFNAADGAIATCRSMKARVCRHAEIHQACSDGVDPYAGLDSTGAGSSFWYGDIVGDNLFQFAPVDLARCSQTDNFGNAASGIVGAARFRCCY